MDAQKSLDELVAIQGGKAAALIDYHSGMILASSGGGFNLDVAASGNTEVIRTKMKVMAELKLDDVIEDILITLGKQYHIIRPCVKHAGLFVYLVVDKTSNLAMARRKVQELESHLDV